MAAIHEALPVWSIGCDKCFAKFRPADGWDARSEHRARDAARLEGWQVRPYSGIGSRSLPDLCPDHRLYDCPNGCGHLDWVSDQFHCPACGDEWHPEVIIPNRWGAEAMTPEEWLRRLTADLPGWHVWTSSPRHWAAVPAPADVTHTEALELPGRITADTPAALQAKCRGPR